MCKGEESSHPHLYIILGKTSIVPDWQWCNMWDFHNTSYVEKVHFYSFQPLLLRCSYICMIFILLLWCSTLIKCLNEQLTLHSWDKSHLVIVYNHFSYGWIWLLVFVWMSFNIFKGYFRIFKGYFNIHEGYLTIYKSCLHFFFSSHICMFWYQSNTDP